MRWDHIVHVARFTEGFSDVALDGRGTPTNGSFRLHMWCERTAKMYCGGDNRFTDAHPTCVRCLGALYES